MTDIGFNGMWLPQDQDPRMTRRPRRGERAVLVEYLEHYRATLELKCEGLTPEQLGTRSVPPSRMSLLGMVRHLARVEHSWFRRTHGGPARPRAALPARGGRRLRLRRADAGARRRGVRAAGARRSPTPARCWSAPTSTPSSTCTATTIEVRDIVVHMIEEYARHCGHADLLRECMDGRTGQ